MHSVSDLTTSSRKTTGAVPPKLVGASTTIVGDKMYLFGGRLVAERRMVADLYVFDLDTFVWTKVPPHAGDDVPGARYFHSADSWQNYLIVFGGMGHKPDASSADDLVVLNDVRFLDLATYRWLSVDSSVSSRSPTDASTSDGSGDPIDPIASTSSADPATFIPRARYAHLSAVSGTRLYVIGGQDLQNAWLDDVCVYDLRARRWAARRPYLRHAGTYRSVAVAAQLRVRDPAKENEGRTAGASGSGQSIGPPGGRFAVNRQPSSGKGEYTPSEDLVHLPYSTDPTDDFPNELFLYSNYNFTDVKRELEVFTPQPGKGDFQMSDRSSAMTGTVLPPGLRFPTGAICGNHLIFAGTYLAHSYQSYSIWALDLTTMAWTRLDPGAALATGSWFRAALWNSPTRGTSSLLIFGNRQGSLVEDYNRRLLAWDDVAVLDLEAFGIYQPPRLVLDIKAQELGLAALEEGLLTDFELVCDDGRRIACSRRLLESRWPWFRDQRRLLRDQATRALENAVDRSADAIGPSIPGDLVPAPIPLSTGAAPDARPDPRITPRALLLSEPYAVTLALLQYLYAQALLTPLQHAPPVLSQLLLLSATYNLTHLQALVRHAMHRALAPATSVGVYEVATLCACQSLQIRALKAVMASSRRNTGRARGNSSAGAGGGPGGSGPSRGPGVQRPQL
ncbi:galactose oxidase [Phellopilus nigrolimitatus]|nr:galactose oxidase [Phellopilus nigrolimitatus]